MNTDPQPAEKIRLDKWLWAARFFKTRSLATQAVDNGRVKLNGARVKPAHEIKTGDRLDIHAGEADWTLMVRGLSTQRGPAPVAQALYEEDPASLARRQQQLSDRKLMDTPGAALRGRPTKRDRRHIHRFTDA
jgi:ribosome-associated heat shock protein Hsp15